MASAAIGSLRRMVSSHARLDNPYLLGALAASCTCFTAFIYVREMAMHRIWADTLEASRHLETIRDRDCALIFDAKDDYNGAIRETTPKVTAMKIRSLGITPLYWKVDKTEEIFQNLEKIQRQNNRIRLLMLRAHGNPSGMRFNDSLQALSWRLNRSISRLDPGAKVVLMSCSTGKDLWYFPSFARILSTYNKAITVFAPKEDAIASWFFFDISKACDGKLDLAVRFADENNNDITVKFQNGKIIS